MKVKLHIEHLVLEGVSPADGRAVGAALERELGRLITEQGLPQSWGGSGVAQGREISHLDAGSLSLPTSPRPRTLGGQIARQVYGGPKT